MVKILSWNTLESGEGGAWSNGWGCPLELQRREVTMHERGVTQRRAEAILSRERYHRLRRTLLDEILGREAEKDPLDFLLFQECTVGDLWDEPSQSNNTTHTSTGQDDEDFFSVFGSLYERIPCHDDENIREGATTLQHVYVRKASPWKPTTSMALQSEALEGGGCLAEFVRCPRGEQAAEIMTHDCSGSVDAEEAPSLVLVNLHGHAGTMRNPDLRQKGIAGLWKELESHFGKDDNSWKTRTIFCGDWNTQLTDLIPAFQRVVDRSSSGKVPVWLEPRVGMLDNATGTHDDYPYFSTNHEDGFLAQYDGCLWLEPDRSVPGQNPPTPFLELEGTSWNLTGFMPKGRDAKLPTVPNNFTYHDGLYLNGTLLPGTLAGEGLSDHLRIYTSIRVHDRTSDSGNENGGSNGNDNALREPSLPQNPYRQRRPYRDYSSEETNAEAERPSPEDENHRTNGLRGG